MRGEQFYDLLLSPLSHISEFRNNYRILKQTDCLFQLRRVFCTIISGVQRTICQIIHFILTTLCIYRGWEQPRSWTKLLWFTIILQFPSKQYEWLSTLFQAVIECLLKLFTCPRVHVSAVHVLRAEGRDSVLPSLLGADTDTEISCHFSQQKFSFSTVSPVM